MLRTRKKNIDKIIDYLVTSALDNRELPSVEGIAKATGESVESIEAMLSEYGKRVKELVGDINTAKE